MKLTAVKSKFFVLTATATTFVFLTKLSIFTASPAQTSTGSVTDNIEVISVTFDPRRAKEGDEESTQRKRERVILENRAGVLAERARAVARVCQETPATKSALEAGNFIWDLKHTPSIVWCPIYKVASTTWLRNFLRLAHFNEDNPEIPDGLPEERREKRRFLPKYGANHNTAFEMYHSPPTLEERDLALRKSARVIIVRHPFTRLLSAYRDKIIKANPRPKKFKFKELQAYIVAKYRKGHSASASAPPRPTFPEFVQHVIDSTQNLSSAAEWRENVKCWTPYWAHCNVCNFDYTVIMKLESMQQDEQFLITLSHLDELKNRTSWVHLNGASSTQLAMQYYKELTRHQMSQLYKRYELDFKLFQYDIDDFLSIAKDA
ncbi:carbohydrate sulfotransferase 10-like [Penaeus indicus]|uniref:carbohydrate sulfotransferase 10-like n=1 Tax=Penaeus indicus TaxID=29960 RepID=UPI00300C8B81